MELLEELMLPKIGLTNRFDPNQLDSLLHTELKKKSINIPYDYAIINPSSGRLIEISKEYSKIIGQFAQLTAFVLFQMIQLSL